MVVPSMQRTHADRGIRWSGELGKGIYFYCGLSNKVKPIELVQFILRVHAEVAPSLVEDGLFGARLERKLAPFASSFIGGFKD